MIGSGLNVQKQTMQYGVAGILMMIRLTLYIIPLDLLIGAGSMTGRQKMEPCPVLVNLQPPSL